MDIKNEKNNEKNKSKEKVEENNLKRVVKIIVVGTSHVSEEAKNKIRNVFLTYKPNIIAVELDKNRAYALENNIERKNNFFSLIKEFGLFATLFYYLGSFIQKNIGEKLDFKPGSEMLEAIKLGRENNIPVALVDKNIEDTFKNFKKIPFREKLKLFYFILTGKFYDKEFKKLDLKKIPSDEIVEKIILSFKKDFPIFYDVLVESRNRHISKNIIRISNYYDKILLIVGKGHVEGIKNILEKNFKKNKVELIIL